MIDWEILKKSVLGTLNFRERQALEQWLAESARHRRFLETIRAHYATPPEKVEMDAAGLDEAWRRFAFRARRRSLRVRSIRAAAGIAACVTVALCLWTLTDRGPAFRVDVPATQIIAGTTQAILTVGEGERILLSGEKQGGAWREFVAPGPDRADPGEESAAACIAVAPKQIRIEVPKGGEYRLQLPDSTQVWLNSQTVIEYPSRFADSCRSVALSGEAFFDVTKAAAQPFTIATSDGLKITVMGTRFNVSSYLDADCAQVTLLEGSVAVCGGDSRVVLAPCEQALFDRSSGALTRQEAPNAASYCAWTGGMFDFKLQPLVTIFDAVSKWYDIEIRYDQAAVGRFNAVTLQCERRSDFTHVMEILQQVTDLDYRVEGRSVHIAL